MKINLKICFLLLFSLMYFSGLISAQKSLQGIYLTADDFRQRKIAFSPMPNSKYKISLNEVFRTSVIKINTGDSSYTFNKDSIYAYRNDQGLIYRFYQKETYEILNPGEFILLYKQSSLGGYKNLQTTVNYYFSSTYTAAIQTLTKQNLKQSLPGDPLFHELIDLYFKSDSDLLDFDRTYGMYKINRAYQLSKELILKQ